MARNEKELNSLIQSATAFVRDLERSDKRPRLWSFTLGRSIQREDLSDPAIDIHVPWPTDASPQNPQVKAHMGRLERFGHDSRILDVKVSQDLLGTDLVNHLRKPMRELQLAEAARNWNL